MSSTSPLLTFAIRGTQALFAIIVFALSISLIRGHHLGSLPTTLGFVTFVGGLSIVGALLGVAAQWLVMLQGQVAVLVDTIIAGLNIAGGILMATKLKGVKCDKYNNNNWEDNAQENYKNHYDLLHNNIICGGYQETKDRQSDCYYYTYGKLEFLTSRCKMSQADTAFMFLTSIVVIGAATLGYLRLKKGH